MFAEVLKDFSDCFARVGVECIINSERETPDLVLRVSGINDLQKSFTARIKQATKILNTLKYQRQIKICVSEVSQRIPEFDKDQDSYIIRDRISDLLSKYGHKFLLSKIDSAGDFKIAIESSRKFFNQYRIGINVKIGEQDILVPISSDEVIPQNRNIFPISFYNSQYSEDIECLVSSKGGKVLSKIHQDSDFITFICAFDSLKDACKFPNEFIMDSQDDIAYVKLYHTGNFYCHLCGKKGHTSEQCEELMAFLNEYRKQVKLRKAKKLGEMKHTSDFEVDHVLVPKFEEGKDNIVADTNATNVDSPKESSFGGFRAPKNLKEGTGDQEGTDDHAENRIGELRDSSNKENFSPFN